MNNFYRCFLEQESAVSALGVVHTGHVPFLVHILPIHSASPWITLPQYHMPYDMLFSSACQILYPFCMSNKDTPHMLNPLEKCWGSLSQVSPLQCISLYIMLDILKLISNRLFLRLISILLGWKYNNNYLLSFGALYISSMVLPIFCPAKRIILIFTVQHVFYHCLVFPRKW
jgi:hypothetical protein